MKAPNFFIGIILGLVLTIFVREFSHNCSKSSEIISKIIIKPSTIVTTTEEKSDTLYIYKER